jgi:excisionase family DNA binding protein
MNLVNESYLTVREVSEIFRITHSTVYAWIKNQSVHAVQVGGSWRIPQSQFERGVAAMPLIEVGEEKADE